MEEKYLVNDILNDARYLTKEYTEAVLGTENIEIRTEIQTLRNFEESFQYDLLKIAKSKGYYPQTKPATAENIAEDKDRLTIK